MRRDGGQQPAALGCLVMLPPSYSCLGIMSTGGDSLLDSVLMVRCGAWLEKATTMGQHRAGNGRFGLPFPDPTQYMVVHWLLTGPVRLATAGPLCMRPGALCSSTSMAGKLPTLLVRGCQAQPRV